MSENFHAARHRATPALTHGLKSVSKAVSSHAGGVGRPAAAFAAASALLLGVGAPAQASATANEPAAVAAASTAAPAPTGASAEPEVVTGASSHTVQSGDTLNSIATMYGVGLETDYVNLSGTHGGGLSGTHCLVCAVPEGSSSGPRIPLVNH